MRGPGWIPGPGLKRAGASPAYRDEGHLRVQRDRSFSLGANLANIVDQLGTIDHASVTNNVAELVLTRTEGGQTYGYTIYLLLGPDGIWRIDGM